MDLVRMIGKKDSPQECEDFVYIEARPGEARDTLSDCTKAHKILDWKAKIRLEEWLGK